MNSEKPPNQSSDFPGSFDHEEIEINVAYEEITSEKESSNPGRVIDEDIASRQPGQNKSVEVTGDIWQEENKSNRSLSNNSVDLDKSSSGNINLKGSASRELGKQKLGTISTQEEAGNRDQVIKDEVEPIKSDLISSEPKASETSKYQQSEFSSKQSETRDLEIETPEVETSEVVSTNYVDSQNSDFPSSESQAPQLSPVEDSISQKNKTNSAEDQGNFATTSISNTESKVENTRKQPELIADSWLNEEEIEEPQTPSKSEQPTPETNSSIDLERQKAALVEEIKLLKIEKETLVNRQNQAIVESLGVMIDEGTRELREQKKYLLQDIERLERRRERIRMEMRANFAGASQDLAMRVQGFKEYLVGSLQDLATAAERLELSKPEAKRRPRSEDGRDFREERLPRESRRPREGRLAREEREANENRESRRERPSREGRRLRGSSAGMVDSPQFNDRSFSQQAGRIRQLLDRYRTQPDYYGPPWQLRRTFESIHADRVGQWFFEQGGRGSVKGMGSRLQNILVASAITSVLYQLYRDRCRILVLVDSPEQLGEWRRGLQDCLGISRNDFGANRGVVLFESPEALMQRAERLLDDKLLPLIIIDESEGAVNMGLLRFPLWLAFAEKPQMSRSSGYLY